MSDLCHGAKAVPNGEKYKNRFDIRKWCQTRCSSRILGAATVIGMALSKRKNAAIRWDHSVLVRLSGFEPLAFRLGGGRSIRLSYRRKSKEKC